VSDDGTIDVTSVMDSNKSFASSVGDYPFENGRRYHAYRPGEYALPNDEREQDRLTLVHDLFKELVNGALYRAPIIPTEMHRILDFGTGTGIWAAEMADNFPHMTIIGTDLSPIQMTTWCPPNCLFHVDDIESVWAYGPEEAFDYIHGRAMAGSVRDWESLLNEIQAHLNPGGWAELQEFEIRVRCDDGTLEHAMIIKDWLQKVNEASMRFGKQMNVVETLRQKMLDANFINVTDELIKCPIGSWPEDARLKRLGRLHLMSVMEAVEPYTLALFTRILGYSCEEAKAYMAQVQKEFLNPSYHLYVTFHFVYGQKPMDS